MKEAEGRDSAVVIFVSAQTMGELGDFLPQGQSAKKKGYRCLFAPKNSSRHQFTRTAGGGVAQVALFPSSDPSATPATPKRWWSDEERYGLLGRLGAPLPFTSAVAGQ